MPLAHQFHHGMAAHDADHLLAHAGTGGRPHLVVHEEARADDGRIANTPAQFVGHAAGGAGTAKIPDRIQRKDPDSVVVPFATRQRVLDVGHRLVLRGLQPLLPLQAALLGEKVLFCEAVLQSELQCAFTGQHHMGRAVHHHAGHGNSMHDMLQRGHRSTTSAGVHDASIQGDVTIAVRTSAEPHGLVGRVGLRHARSGLNGIQGMPAILQDLPCGSIRLLSKVPGGDHNGRPGGPPRCGRLAPHGE